MPSIERRRETDLRAGRFESQIRSPEKHLAVDKVNSKKGLMFCNRCKTSFEEYSRFCPRCDRSDEVGKIKPIPVEFREQLHNKELAKARRRQGL